jgi:formylglycine-generating enzyme required for sulfatase activity
MAQTGRSLAALAFAVALLATGIPAEASAGQIRQHLQPVPALSDEEFTGPFPSWHSVKTSFGARGDGVTDDTQAFQRALDAMRDLRQLDWCVLYVPAGTYRITAPLRSSRFEFWDYLGFSMVGEDPATTVIVWDGPADGTMLDISFWYGKVSRLTLAGQGKAGIGLYRHQMFSSACEVSDVVFRDMGTGIQFGGDFQGGQAETAVTRCTFSRCWSAGVATVDYNSLDIWLFYCHFVDCARGAWNVMGNFHAYGCVFERSTQADIESTNLAPFAFVNNVSVGSRVFFDFQGGHSWGSPTLVQGNRIYDTTRVETEFGPLVNVAMSMLTGNGGPWVLLDNLIRSPLGRPGPAVVLSSKDQVLVGNTYTVRNAEWSTTWGGPRRIRSLDANLVDRESAGTPPLLLPPTPPKVVRRVIEVVRGTGDDAGAIQAAVDAAAHEPYGTRPVVHIPKGYYAITGTVVVPALRDVQLVGDGLSAIGGGDGVNGTYLSWDGAGSGPLLRLDGPSRVVLRDMSVHGRGKGWGGGILITDCDQPGGRVFADQLMAIYHNNYDFADYGVLVDGLAATDVTLLHTSVGGAANSGVLVKGAPGMTGYAAAQVALVTGTAAGPFSQLFAVADGGRLSAEEIWIESQEHALQIFDSGSRGVMTLAGLLFDVTTALSSPSFAISDSPIRLTLLASILVSYDHSKAPAPWIGLSGDGRQTSILSLGNIFWVDATQPGGATVDATYAWRDTTAPPAQAALSHSNLNGNSPQLPGGFDFLDHVTGKQAGVEASETAIRDGVEQLRERRIETPVARRPGVTDVKLFRVWVTGGPGCRAALELRGTQDHQAPDAPSGLTAVALAPNQVKLTWTDMSSNEADFRIERTAGMSGAFLVVGVVPGGGASFVDCTTSPNTPYTYRAWVTSAEGPSRYSNLATVTTPGPPAGPWDLAAAAGTPSRIDLSWLDNATNESGFAIERRSPGSSTFTLVGTAPANAAAFQDGGLPTNAVFTYRVRAINEWGTSRFSNEATARTALAGAVVTTDPIVGRLRYVRAGTFTQGSPPDEHCRINQESQFTNTLTRNLAVMETEVTRQMWADLLAVQPTLPADPSEVSTCGGMACPVQRVTWYETMLFANLLSLQQGLTRCYYTDASRAVPIDAGNYAGGAYYCDFDADGYRLPTEGEWEHLARAGTTGPFFAEVPEYSADNCGLFAQLGDFPALEVVSWFGPFYVSAECTRPAGLKTPNPWGLRDVLGNVAEWCWDPYQELYPEGMSVTDWVGAGGDHRVARGGGCGSRPEELRSAYRNNRNVPDHRWYDKGFRLVRTAP